MNVLTPIPPSSTTTTTSNLYIPPNKLLSNPSINQPQRPKLLPAHIKSTYRSSLTLTNQSSKLSIGLLFHKTNEQILKLFQDSDRLKRYAFFGDSLLKAYLTSLLWEQYQQRQAKAMFSYISLEEMSTLRIHFESNKSMALYLCESTNILTILPELTTRNIHSIGTLFEALLWDSVEETTRNFWDIASYLPILHDYILWVDHNLIETLWLKKLECYHTLSYPNKQRLESIMMDTKTNPSTSSSGTKPDNTMVNNGWNNNNNNMNNNMNNTMNNTTNKNNDILSLSKNNNNRVNENNMSTITTMNNLLTTDNQTFMNIDTTATTTNYDDIITNPSLPPSNNNTNLEPYNNIKLVDDLVSIDEETSNYDKLSQTFLQLTINQGRIKTGKQHFMSRQDVQIMMANIDSDRPYLNDEGIDHQWFPAHACPQNQDIYGNYTLRSWFGRQCQHCHALLVSRKTSNRSTYDFLLGLRQCPGKDMDWLEGYKEILQEKITSNQLGWINEDELESWGFFSSQKLFRICSQCSDNQVMEIKTSIICSNKYPCKLYDKCSKRYPCKRTTKIYLCNVCQSQEQEIILPKIPQTGPQNLPLNVPPMGPTTPDITTPNNTPAYTPLYSNTPTNNLSSNNSFNPSISSSNMSSNNYSSNNNNSSSNNSSNNNSNQDNVNNGQSPPPKLPSDIDNNDLISVMTMDSALDVSTTLPQQNNIDFSFDDDLLSAFESTTLKTYE